MTPPDEPVKTDAKIGYLPTPSSASCDRPQAVIGRELSSRVNHVMWQERDPVRSRNARGLLAYFACLAGGHGRLTSVAARAGAATSVSESVERLPGDG